MALQFKGGKATTVGGSGKVNEPAFRRPYYEGDWDEVRSLALKHQDPELSQAVVEIQSAMSKVFRILNKKYIWD